MQRPFLSQSPYLVGSGPEGPPISRGRDRAEVAIDGSRLAALGAAAGPDVVDGESGLIDAESGVDPEVRVVDTTSEGAAGRTGCGDDSAFFSARFGIRILCQNLA